VMVTRAIADYKKIGLVSETLRVLDDDADANSCRAVAVEAQVKEYQIGCRDSEDEDLILITTPFNITEAAFKTSSEHGKYEHLGKVCQVRKDLGESVSALERIQRWETERDSAAPSTRPPERRRFSIVRLAKVAS